MIDPTNTLGTKLHRDARAYEALKADLERDAAKLALFNDLVSAVEKLHGALSMTVVSKHSPAAIILRQYAQLLQEAWALQK